MTMPLSPPILNTNNNYKSLSDSEKLDQLLAGFERLQFEYNEIKKDHKILRDECKQLREENKRLREALKLMSANSGKDLHQCEQLLEEIEELKDTVIQGQLVLEQYKENLKERNFQLEAALEALQREQGKKCNCFVCRITGFWAKKKVQ